MNWREEQIKVRRKPPEFQDGFASYIAGHHQGANPFPIEKVKQRNEWETGWFAAHTIADKERHR